MRRRGKSDHPESGDDSDLTVGHAGGQPHCQLRGVHLVRPCLYEIVFAGQADRTLRAQFDECTVSTGPDTTILRAELPDQAALCGLVERIVGLGLEIIRLQLVTPSRGHDGFIAVGSEP